MGLTVALCAFLTVDYPSLSLAASRQEIIDDALTQTETSRPETTTAMPPDWTPANFMGPSETLAPLNLPSPADEAARKRKAVEVALYLAAGYDLNHIHYSEWQGDDKLDEDFGYQHGFYLTLGYKSPRYREILRGKPFIEGYLRQYGSTIKYKGAAFNEFGETMPFNTDQKSRVTRFGLKLGTRADLRQAGEVFLYLDGGRRIWDRGENGIVDNVIVYKETYEWWYYGVGLGMDYEILPKISLGIDWTGWLTSEAKMKAELFEGGTFRLKSVWGTEVKIPVRYRVSDKLSLDVTPYYTFWRINESDVVSISGMPLVEPDSNTNELGVLFGFTYSL